MIIFNPLWDGIGRTQFSRDNRTSWNFYACNVNETVIRGTADALVYTGFFKMRLSLL
jgi:hypothetical protein